MTNLSKKQRDRMYTFLENLKANMTEEEIISVNEIENFLVNKKYGLVWEEHEENVDVKLVNSIPVYIEDEEKKIIKDPESKMNFLLEGDNLHSLYLLEKTHSGQIDCIYIDPPYNTENEGFTYNDKKVDVNDGFRHSKWISFMEKRLNIAKQLLTKNGVVYISIDDNEYANLKILCDTIFGPNKYVSTVIWQKKTGASDAKGIANITEYILVYCNNSDKSTWSNIFTQNFGSFDKKRYRLKDEYYEERGPFYFDNLDRGTLGYHESLDYPIETPDGTVTHANGRTHMEDDGWRWKWGKDKLKWGLENGFIDIQKSESKNSGWGVYYKIYLNVDNEGNKIDRSSPYKNLIQNVLNTDGTNELKHLFGKSGVFSNPKPSNLIKQLVSWVNNPNATILDFFAGSGTTGHAVLSLNKEDDGTRSFILCNSNENENKIAEKITYERLAKVINGYETSGNFKEILFEESISISKLKQGAALLAKADKIVEENKSNFDNVKKEMKDGVLRVIGEHKKNSQVPGIAANLKYFKTDYIERMPNEEIILSDLLMEHIKPIIEIDFGIDLSNNDKVKLIFNEDELDALFASDDIKDLTILLSRDVLLTGIQEDIIEKNNINLRILPEYYFVDELREVGEL